MSTLEHIQAPISNILQQLATAQKGFGELKDFIKSSKEHKLLRNELGDLKLCLNALQSAILKDPAGLSLDDEFEDLIASFNASFNEFLEVSQEAATLILGLPNTEVNTFLVKIRSFRKQITTQFSNDTLANYEEDQAQISRSDQAEQEVSGVSYLMFLSKVYGGTGGAGGRGGKQGGLGGRGEGAQLTFNNTNTVYLAAKDKKNKILDWLTSINFFQRQDAIFETWQEGTGKWFLSSPEFTNWISNSEKALWCEGPPGAGKTVLSSLVVKHIEDKVQTSKIGLAYIYINHKELGSQSPTALFASLCKQLLLNKSLPLMLQDLWQYHSARKTQPTLDDVVRLLEIVFLEYPTRIYVVIDALDEYFNTTHEHRWFSNLQLVSITAEQADIALYIANQFKISDNLFQLLKNKPHLMTEIQLAIVQDVNEMQVDILIFPIFLLAKLRIDHLGAQTTVASLRGALKTLPSTLTAAYEVTMARINTQAEGFQKLAQTTLMWISNALRPLSVAELCQILAVEPGDTSLNPDKVPHIETILTACAGLVTVDIELSVVRVVHYTAQDWLETQFPDGHKEIALTSFQYLEFPEFDGLQYLDKEKYSFAVYAQYCLEHTRMTNCEMGLIGQVALFARRAYLWKCLWQSLNWSVVLPIWKDGPWPEAKEDFQTLILAAAGNLQTVNQHLLREEQFDTRHYKCALSLAAYAGHSEIVKVLLNLDVVNSEWGMIPAIQKKRTEIVQLLLDAGAAVNIVGGTYGTALQAAAYRESEAIVKMLLDAEADLNIVSGDYGTALQAAAYGNTEPIVKMLLEAGADVNIVGGKYGTALQAAADRESEAIVKTLLDAGVAVNIVGGEYGTALQAAAYRESEAIVKMLLDAEADLNIVSGDYGTALQAAAYGNSEPIVKMLLEAGADVNIVGGEYGTALQAAARFGYEPIVKMLLDAGTDVNIVGGSYDTALQAAAYGNSEPIVKMLIDAGAAVNIVGGTYGTVLQAAAYRESEAIVKMLLDAEADLNIVSGDYGTALQAAAYGNAEPIVKMLLNAGADVNIVGGYYGTALQAAARFGFEPAVKMLLDVGADMNIVGGEYGTALQAAAYWKSEPIVKMLLEAGAATNIVGGEYGTALQAAARFGYEPIVKMLLDAGTDVNIMLLEAGADVNIVGGEYGTALQAAACMISEPIVEMLLDAGADVNIVGGTFGTALYAAARLGFEPIVKMLIHAGADINIVGSQYGTALQAAVAWNESETESVVKLLLDAGANPNLTGGVYSSALKAAKALGLQTIEHMLLEAGADNYEEEAEMEVAVSEMPILNSDEKKSSQIVGLPVMIFVLLAPWISIYLGSR
ncbi:ANK-REP-region domain-containing protein [Favolaschia claudopus]|uniref:ANK-REP-region domain-containing protein n=1 Tax=Favolaschia claudopus TaxID=2862362 RepID=A0AAW0DMA2_9AGAR